MNILLTGYTGNLGGEIAKALSAHYIYAVVRDASSALAQAHVTVHSGSLENLPLSLAEKTEVIIHSAANTSFRTPIEELRKTNVDGTADVLAFAKKCPHLDKFVHVSTACVCGTAQGEILEVALSRPAAFVNAYEESKWEAEELVFNSSVPSEIVRLSIVAGSAHDGSVHRMGALHHTLFWLWKGLVPMMPGTPATKVDLISTEYAAAVVAACMESPLVDKRVIHGCAGDAAPELGALLDYLTEIFANHSRAWESGSLIAPAIVDAETFSLFEQSVQQSRDALFLRVSEDARSFLPGLLHPRKHCTANADAICRQPRADWKSLTNLVTRHVIASRS